MIWAGIVGDELFGFVRVPEGVKLTSRSYCHFLKTLMQNMAKKKDNMADEHVHKIN